LKTTKHEVDDMTVLEPVAPTTLNFNQRLTPDLICD